MCDSKLESTQESLITEAPGGLRRGMRIGGWRACVGSGPQRRERQELKRSKEGWGQAGAAGRPEGTRQGVLGSLGTHSPLPPPAQTPLLPSLFLAGQPLSPGSAGPLSLHFLQHGAHVSNFQAHATPMCPLLTHVQRPAFDTRPPSES